MSQLIITTDVASIRPVFAEGAAENIKRYNQLKKLFENTEEYKIFAEPVFAGQDKIAWHTQYEGKIIPFRKLRDDEEEQEKAKRLLKNQVNKLYKRIIELIDEENTRERLFALIDSCLEIPDYDDIFIIQNTNGEKNYCIVRWGFVNDNFDAPTGLIAKLIPLKVADITVKVIKGNNKYAINEKIFIEIEGEEKELISDDKAEIRLNDVKLLSEISIYQKDEDGNRLYEQKYKIFDDAQITFFIGNQEFIKQNVIIQTLDSNDDILPHANLKIQYDDVEINAETDDEGKLKIGELFDGTVIKCSQIRRDKVIKTVEITVKKGKEIYFISLIRQKNKANVKIQVKSEDGQIIGNAEFQVKFPDGEVKHFKSDENGIIQIENAPLREAVIFRQIIDGLPQFQQILKFEDEGKIYQLKGIKVKQPGDITKLKVTVIDASESPISNLRIKIENGVKTYHKITNENGMAIFDNIDCYETIKVIADYKNKKKEQNVKCEGAESSVTIQLGKKAGLLWLWILLALLLIGLAIYFIPKIDFSSKKVVANDTTQTTTDTTTIPIVKPSGMTLNLVDENGNPVVNADVEISANDSILFSAKSDNFGKINFAELTDTTQFITAIVKTENKKEQRFKFKVTPEKTLTIHEQSVDISEEILPCGTNVKSLGYHSTIKTFHMKTNSGQFKLRYNMNTIPDKIIVYNGSSSNISKDKIIWQSPSPEKNIHTQWLKFNSPDSLVTVEIQGGDTLLTQWDFTVFCPKMTSNGNN